MPLGWIPSNAVVVQRLLTERGTDVSVRTIERAVADIRRARRAAAMTTVRVFLLVAVLSYSRRLFLKAFLNERQDDWREGSRRCSRTLAGVPRMLLGDNARALVVGRDRATGTVIFQPAYLAFCPDWDVQPRACAPYRARTKGKTEPRTLPGAI